MGLQQQGGALRHCRLAMISPFVLLTQPSFGLPGAHMGQWRGGRGRAGPPSPTPPSRPPPHSCTPGDPLLSAATPPVHHAHPHPCIPTLPLTPFVSPLPLAPSSHPPHHPHLYLSPHASTSSHTFNPHSSPPPRILRPHQVTAHPATLCESVARQQTLAAFYKPCPWWDPPPDTIPHWDPMSGLCRLMHPNLCTLIYTVPTSLYAHISLCPHLYTVPASLHVQAPTLTYTHTLALTRTNMLAMVVQDAARFC